MSTVSPFSATAQVKSLAGTAAAPGITFTGNTSTGLFSPAANQIAVTTGGVQRLLIGADGTITPSGSLLFPAGTAAAPSVSFTGDTNTGVYSPGPDTVAVATNGAGRLFVDASGNVFPNAISFSLANLPIGGPGFKGVSNGTQLDAPVEFYATSSNERWSTIFSNTNGLVGAISTFGNGVLYYTSVGGGIRSASGNASDVSIFTSSSERLRITSAGLVGIGTSLPGALLHLSSATGSATPTPTELRVATTTSASDWSTTAPWGRLSYYSADTSGGGPKIHASIDTTANTAAKLISNLDFKISEATTGSLVNAFSIVSGNTAANVSLRMGAGTNGIQFNNQTDTGINSGTQTLLFTTAGSERLRITSAGRVGIGTSAPAHILETLQAGSSSVTVGASLAASGNGGAGRGIGLLFKAPGDFNTVEVARIDGRQNSLSTTANNASLNFMVANPTGVLTERLTILNTGNVGIGTSIPETSLHVDTGSILASGGDIINESNIEGLGSFFHTARKSRGTFTSKTIVLTNDVLGGFSALGYDGSQYINGSQLRFIVDSDPVGGSMPTAFVVRTGTTAGGSERMRITSAGNVGIATTTPAQTFECRGSTRISADNFGHVEIIPTIGNGGTAVIQQTTIAPRNGGDLAIQVDTRSQGGNLLFRTGGSTERARIDSSGRLLVGTSSALLTQNLSANGGAASSLQVVATSTANANTLLATFQSLGFGHQLSFATSRGSTVGTPVQANDTLGRIAFFGDDGTDIISSGASILCAVDGTPGADDMPGRLVFSVTADGASSPTEALRITNDRVVAYNQDTPAAVNATATLTVANLKTGIITSTSAAATDMTLPTGTDTEAGFSRLYTNFTFEWTVINTGPSLVSVLAATAHTIVGSGSVATGTSGRFASRRTAANTFVTYRLS
jgi:hypothetical protein